jgi:hypothetical protein
VGDISRQAVAIIEDNLCRVFNLVVSELWTPSFIALAVVNVGFGHPVRQEMDIRANSLARHATCFPQNAGAPFQAAKSALMLIFATAPPPEK